MPILDITNTRTQFPALNQTINGIIPIFFDGPGGAQVTERLLNASREYLAYNNSNLGSKFFASVKTTDVLNTARQSMQALLNAPSSNNIVFGSTATMLMFNFSRAISRDWQTGDEIVVTALDHYSNVSSWEQAAKDKGVVVHKIRIDKETFEIDYQQLEQVLNKKTKLVAFTYASNTLGSVLDAERIVKMAKSVGALIFIDAVHYAPHFSIDVQALDCDFLVVSGYKFTAPHVAAIYGKTEHLEGLTPYKVEPAPQTAPLSWEQGTANFEGLAGLSAAIEYLASLSDTPNGNLRERLVMAFKNIAHYEQSLSDYFLEKINALDGINFYGKQTSSERTPTFSFRITKPNKNNPNAFADFCADNCVAVGAGNFYAQGFCEQFDIMQSDGVIRVGCLHYNTKAEIDRFFELLSAFLGE